MPKVEDRRLAAIMFADIVGYSRMMSLDEDRTLSILEDFEEICPPIIDSFKGKIIKKSGDEIFCEFSSAKNAVDAAMNIQTSLSEYNDSQPKDFRLMVRIGIHIGDIVKKADGDVFGDGVNVASRIQPLASPGGICISSSVQDALRGHPKYDIVKRGEHEIKNILDKYSIFQITTGFEESSDDMKQEESSDTSSVPDLYKGAWKIFTDNITVCLVNTAIMYLVLPFLIISIIGIFAIPAVFGGYTESIIRLVSGKKVEIGDFFKVGFDNFKVLLGANILRIFGILFGLILLIIPGVYLMTRWFFVTHIIICEQATVKESFARSKEITSTTFWIVLTILFINTIFGSIVLTITSGILVLALTPYKSIVWAKYYLENFYKVKVD